jgi:hypothetical protein
VAETLHVKGTRAYRRSKDVGVDGTALAGGEFVNQSYCALPEARDDAELTRIAMSEETWDDERARKLEALLRALGRRIAELDAQGDLLRHAGELTSLMGDLRSELFHYEVRATYDTPELLERRRIVSEAEEAEEHGWERSEWSPEDDDPRR